MGTKEPCGEVSTLPSNLSEPLRPLKNSEARRGDNCALEIKMKYLRLELKVCEGCGALWLRAGVGDGVYCSKCAFQLSKFPVAKGKHPGGRPRRLARASMCSATRLRPGGVR